MLHVHNQGTFQLFFSDVEKKVISKTKVVDDLTLMAKVGNL